jgi:dTDP-L-rhamnose 4-epimerase
VCCAACGDDLRPEPTPEDKPADLRSIYAATKKHQEDLCVAFGQAYGLTTFALRFFNVFGSRQSLRNPYTGVAAIFLSRLLKGHPPLLFEDGGQTRDFIDVRDVARALRFCVEFDGGGVHVLNIGTGRGLTIAEVARALARRLGSRLEPEALGHHRVGDIRHCVGDVSRAASILGFRADHDFEDGLAPLIDWCRLAPVEDRVETSLIALRNAGLVR